MRSHPNFLAHVWSGLKSTRTVRRGSPAERREGSCHPGRFWKMALSAIGHHPCELLTNHGEIQTRKQKFTTGAEGGIGLKLGRSETMKISRSLATSVNCGVQIRNTDAFDAVASHHESFPSTRRKAERAYSHSLRRFQTPSLVSGSH